MQLGSHCLVLSFSSLCSHSCATLNCSLPLFLSLLLYIYKERKEKEKKLILSEARSRPTARVTQNVYSSLPLCLWLPSALTLFTSRTDGPSLVFVSLYFFFNMQIYPFFFFADDIYMCVCVRFIFFLLSYPILCYVLYSLKNNLLLLPTPLTGWIFFIFLSFVWIFNMFI